MAFHLKHRAWGAQILELEWKDERGEVQPVFYLSPLIAEHAPARGGVPVLFPQFSDLGPLPKHGMARNRAWQADGDAAYTLQIAADHYAFWPHACALRLEWTLSDRRLQMGMTVTNTGTTAFPFTGGLHPYFALDDVQHSSLSGLSGLALRDRYNPLNTLQTSDVMGWTHEPCERLYAHAPALVLRNGSHRLHLSTSGFHQWMVWNPGREGAKALADLPDSDWQRFVCVEPVCVDAPVVLAPGEVFQGTFTVVVAS